MPSLSALLGVGAATLFSVASATKYAPADTLPGSSFFDHFDFVTEEKTNGFVKYVDRKTAEQKDYIRYEDGDAIFGVDHTSMLNSADGGDIGRESVRLEGKTDYNKGLFVLDIKHMPGGICGTWPAFWSLGRAEWPKDGEIDIVEGVNKNSGNTLVLHTDTQCKVNGLGQTGGQTLKDCALDTAGTSGCGVNDARTSSYGIDFNKNNGGHYVTEWQAEAIKIWFFPRGTAPKSLTSSEPDTADFGIPVASFQGACDIEKRFKDQRFIFTNTFCGDWGGNVYAQSGCPMYDGLSGMASCKKYVAEHPELYKDAFWRVSSFKTYNKRVVTSSSSVAPSSTPHASSSSIQVSSSSVHVSSSSVPVSSSSVPVSSSSLHVSSSSIPVSSSSVHTTSSSAHVSSSPVPASSSSVAVSSSSAHVSSSSVTIASSSVAVSSSSVQISSSSIADSSSILSSSVAHSSATPTPDVSSSVYPSSTPAVSSSVYDISSSILPETSSTVSISASETPHDHISSSSVGSDYSSGISSSASETPYISSSIITASASETPSSYDISSIISSASASETPYSQSVSVSSLSSSSELSSSSVAISSDSSSIYPSETPSVGSSSVYPSETPSDSTAIYSSGTSSSAFPTVSSSASSSSDSAYSTPAPVYSVYPEDNGYGHASASSQTPDASSKSSEHPTVSSKVPDYGNEYPTASAKTPEYDSYPVASSASASGLKSTSVHDDYPGLPSFTPLYSTYPAGDDAKTTDSEKTTTAYQTTYVDVCSTGYTTITTKVTAIQTAAPLPTTNAYYAPPGFEVTTKYCAQGCGSGPKTVTVTVPCSKCQATTPMPNSPASSASGVPNKPTDTPNKPVDNTPYTPGQPSKPSTPEDSTTKITATKIVTLTKIPVPESQYYATHPSIATPSAKAPGSGSNKGYEADKPASPSNPAPVGGEKAYPTGSAPAEKPVAPTGPAVQPSAGKPVYPTAIGVPGSNVTISYGTATTVNGKPTQTGYKVPEFTGAASGLQVGGVVAGAVAVFAALMM